MVLFSKKIVPLQTQKNEENSLIVILKNIENE
jgi:hypothetical protein